MKKILSIITTLAILTLAFTGCGSSTASGAKDTTSTTASKNQNKQRPDIEGEVSAINGNQVTLKLIEAPPVNQNSKEKTPDQKNQEAARKEQKANGQSGQRPKMEVKYTGETKAITIPDGISITTFDRSSKDGTEKTITAKDIKVGNRLNIWYKDSTKTTISKITVLSLPQASNDNKTQNDSNTGSQSQTQN